MKACCLTYFTCTVLVIFNKMATWQQIRPLTSIIYTDCDYSVFLSDLPNVCCPFVYIG